MREPFAALSLTFRAAATALGLPPGARGELAELSFGELVARLQACVAEQRDPKGGNSSLGGWRMVACRAAGMPPAVLQRVAAMLHIL